MKVYAISDLHLSINCDKPMNIFGPVWEGYLDKIEKSFKKVHNKDIVLLAGDHSWAMKLSEAQPDLDYICAFKGNKFLIKGNHDYWWSSISAVRERLSNNTYALQNDAMKVGKYIICGSRGWILPDRDKFKSEEDKKIYLRELNRMELSLKTMQNMRQKRDKVIVMMHYPPFNYKQDDSEFTKMFEKYGVDIVVYGHLHGYDKKRNKLFLVKNKIKYYLTSCDLVNNQLVRIK